MRPEERKNIQRCEWTGRLSVNAAAVGKNERLYCWISNGIPSFDL